jgi:2-polyprenyl-3-methyl-5-hydroxy-6-metoxy-1,4-benzoquinol methylase
MIDRLTKRYGEAVTGYVSLFEDFAPGRQFDTLIMGHILEHVADPVAILLRAHSWLKKDGVVVITVPNAGSLHRMVGVAMGMLPDIHSFSPGDIALGHRRVYDRSLLRKDVEAAGFQCGLLTGVVLKPLSNAQMDSWTPELRSAYFALGEKLPDQACVLLAIAHPQSER